MSKEEIKGKTVEMTVKKCEECPFKYYKEDDNPMGGNGWYGCKKLNRLLDSKYWHKGIDPECPLPDAV